MRTDSVTASQPPRCFNPSAHDGFDSSHFKTGKANFCRSGPAGAFDYSPRTRIAALCEPRVRRVVPRRRIDWEAKTTKYVWHCAHTLHAERMIRNKGCAICAAPVGGEARLILPNSFIHCRVNLPQRFPAIWCTNRLTSKRRSSDSLTKRKAAYVKLVIGIPGLRANCRSAWFRRSCRYSCGDR